MMRGLLLGSAVLIGLSAPAGAETLRDALAKAYASNPTLTGQRAALRATDEHVPIARASGLPGVAATGSVTDNVLQANNNFLNPERSGNTALNLTVPMLLAQAAHPLMKRSGGGSIVNVASRVYLAGTGVAYTSSKSGLIGLTRVLAVQLGPDNIRVNAVAPSFLNTPFNEKIVAENAGLARSFRKMSPLGRLGTAEDVAGAIAFLASPRASFVTGDIIHVCGGTQLAPQPTAFDEAV